MTNHHAVALSLLSHPRWHREESWKEKAKLVGCDKNSVTMAKGEEK